jgi:hypothetical protein
LRHREFGAEEGNFLDVVAFDAVGGRIGNMQNRDADFFFDLRDVALWNPPSAFAISLFKIS